LLKYSLIALIFLFFDADIVLKFILNHAALSDLSMNSTILERIGVDYISDDYSMIKLNKVNEDKNS